ncbi:hypothetical protein CQA53_10905 [Helicobacter didelphidarum]|uniref:Uncharacterized protein n=1 Tax=Helicobacter didelphidarum TaxID=2040648 RepID=A0A3D8I5Z7_9HELI|nr:hypothetical protein [Helicobacter didelphidarum]RDU60395.1 hypothetical protein CQA53_10905 [Helicobacter didelphidarum]
MLFVIIFFLPIVFTLSYFIWWLIYRKAFKSQKKVSKILVFIGGIGLITFYYTPYSYYLEPSYHEFKKMCKLNELPNNEEKYNKILSYFGLSLDTLDWEELNGRVEKLEDTNGWYEKGKNEYKIDGFGWNKYNNRIEILFIIFSNESRINRYNISFMYLSGIWQTRRYHLEQESMASYNLEWMEEELGCADIVKENEE